MFATVDYQCRMRGASHLAYPPVVAAGDHATVIHYTDNSHQRVDKSDMMLMDAGCEYEGYSSDITRTWPLGGEATTGIIFVRTIFVQNGKCSPCLELTPTT